MFGPEKIDFLYVFNFELAEIENALLRLECSIKSVVKQGVNICLCNNSQVCIYERLIVIAPEIRYIHTPHNGPFSKALGINYGVKNLVKTEYFILSDVDLVYSRDHIQRLKLKCSSLQNGSEPIRFVFYNYNLLPIIIDSAWRKFLSKLPLINIILKSKAKLAPHAYSHEYEVLDQLARQPGGFAHGNGIIHTPSFHLIRGYDEEMIGYGPEDDLFNIRIGKINRLIYDNLPDTSSFHLWHPRISWIQVETNSNIWRERKKFYNSLERPTFMDVLGNINKKDWGII
jgi:hypothetical protein